MIRGGPSGTGQLDLGIRQIFPGWSDPWTPPGDLPPPRTIPRLR